MRPEITHEVLRRLDQPGKLVDSCMELGLLHDPVDVGDHVVDPLADRLEGHRPELGEHIADGLRHLLECGRQGRKLRNGRVLALHEVEPTSREQVEIDVQHAGHDAERLQPRPEAVGDELPEYLARRGALGAELAQPVLVELQEHRDARIAAHLRVAQADIRHLADLHAAELDWGTDVQAVHRAREVADIVVRLLEQASGAPDGNRHDAEHERTDHERADDGGVHAFTHDGSLLPRA